MRPRTEIAVSLGLVLVGWLAFDTIFGSLDGLAEAVDYAPRAFVDFMFVYFPAGAEILETAEPVRGFFYTPFFALSMVPISSLPGPSALDVWIGLQLASVAGLALAAPRVGARSDAVLRVAAIALTLVSFPVVHGLSWGQVSALLVACLLAAAALSRRGRHVAAGALMALTIAIKYYTAGALVAFVARGVRRAAIAAVVFTSILAAGLPALVLGVDGTLAFYGGVLEMIRGSEDLVRADVNSHYVANVVSRWLHESSEEAGATYAATRVVGLVIAAGLAALAAWRARRGDATGVRDGLVLAFLATPFWVPTSWPHYFVYLPFCQLVLGDLAWRGETTTWRRATIGASVGGSVVLASTPFFLVVGDKLAYARHGTLFVADALLVIAALVAWLGSRRSDAGHASARAPINP